MAWMVDREFGLGKEKSTGRMPFGGLQK